MPPCNLADMPSSINITNAQLLRWVEETRVLCRPTSVYWCNGSKEEYDSLCALLVEAGTFTRLNPEKRPNSFLARSDPSDVARVESRTFICTSKKEDAGPSNNWASPTEMKETMNKLFDGCMEGRVMYVIPYCMGPLASPFSKLGVQITDSPYATVNMHIMSRVGDDVLNIIGDHPFLPGLHSVGAPLSPGQKDVSWPCNKTKYICHFPEDPMIISYGSGYGGNALLGKKCHALRIASYQGRNERWMAEHCLILGLTSPEGKKHYVAAGFPSACGKTNLAMLVPTLPGWDVRCVGDDIAWMRPGPDGRLWAVNPEKGFFGVAPGTNLNSNKSAMGSMTEHTIFTNVALTHDGDVWWEGMTEVPPASCIDWTGQPWTPNCGRKAAHPNSRYTVPAAQCPVIDPDWEKAEGVPIDAIIFGGRRSDTIPLITQSFDWVHGVFMGSVCASEQTAAAEGKVGALRIDPFAMLPFIGYNMGDYFQHWLDMGALVGDKAPKIFYVNWFRKDPISGKFAWPGFGENSRVLKWICQRIENEGDVVETPLGWVPGVDSLDLSGLTISRETMSNLLAVDVEKAISDVDEYRQHYARLGDRLPRPLANQLVKLATRLITATKIPSFGA